MRLISYHVPPLGYVEVPLHAESEAAYGWLEQAGDADRLKRVDHLGLVRAAVEGAHHPRWEYVMAVLHLIERCRESDELHVRSHVRYAAHGGEAAFSSGTELMKSWALLLNAGHIFWTFSAERALLLELWSSPPSASEFVSLFPDGRLRAWAVDTIRDSRTYRFYQALAYIRASTIEYGSADQMRKRLAALEGYILEPPQRSRLADVRRTYVSLRRMAYLALDTHYTPSVVALDLAQLSADPRALARLVLSREESELDGVDRHLNRDVYLGQGALMEIAKREHALRVVIRRSLRQSGLAATIDSLLRGDLQMRVAPEDLEVVLRVPGFASQPFDRVLLRRINSRAEQLALEQRARVRRNHVRVAWWGSAGSNEWVIQTHAPTGNAEALATAFAIAFDKASEAAEYARNAAQAFNAEPIFAQRVVSGMMGSEIIVGALRLFLEPSIRWEWRATEQPLSAVLSTASDGRLILRSALRGLTEDARRAELIGTRAQLPTRSSRPVAFSLSPLWAFSAGSRKQLLELDGVVVLLNRTQPVLRLIEVKTQRTSGEGDAIADLRTKLEKLQVRDFVADSIVTVARVGDAAVAVAELTL